MRIQARWCHRLIGGVGQFVVLMAVCTSFFAWSQHSPVGAWKTVDDKTGEEKVIDSVQYGKTYNFGLNYKF